MGLRLIGGSYVGSRVGIWGWGVGYLIEWSPKVEDRESGCFKTSDSAGGPTAHYQGAARVRKQNSWCGYPHDRRRGRRLPQQCSFLVEVAHQRDSGRYPERTHATVRRAASTAITAADDCATTTTNPVCQRCFYLPPKQPTTTSRPQQGRS